MQPQYTPAFLARFWSKVDRNGPIPEYAPHLGPCWIWTACISRGYGQIGGSDGKRWRAHRVAFALAHGPEIVQGMDLDHLCRVTSCVRPSHLEQVTHMENVRRGLSARSNFHQPSTQGDRSNLCQRGHFNWRDVEKNGRAAGRECQTCRNLMQKIRRQKFGRTDR